MINLLGGTQSELEDSILFKSLVGCDTSIMDERVYLDFPDSGLQFLVDTEEDLLDSVFVTPNGLQYLLEDAAFSYKINFSMGRYDIRNLLGEPSMESDPDAKTLLGPIKPWDVYVGTYRLHIQYSEKAESIEVITISLR